MISSLPMYDRPETRAANDRLWTHFRDAYGDDAPKTLTRGENPWDHWTNPALVLSQTCGLPYRAKLHGEVTLVGSPIHDLLCKPGFYYSVIIARRSSNILTEKDFSKPTLAINDPLSQSGWAAANAFADAQNLSFSQVIQTGAHVASAKAVASGKADLAAIDAVTWSLIRKFDNFADDLMVLHETPPTPALPYITRQNVDPQPIFKALEAAIATLSPEDQSILSLTGLTYIPANDYLALPLPPDLP